jgi:hypothetical protein
MAFVIGMALVAHETTERQLTLQEPPNVSTICGCTDMLACSMCRERLRPMGALVEPQPNRATEKSTALAAERSCVKISVAIRYKN